MCVLAASTKRERASVEQEDDIVQVGELEHGCAQLRLDARLVADATELERASQVDGCDAAPNRHALDVQVRLMERGIQTRFAVVRVVNREELAERLLDPAGGRATGLDAC